MKIVNPTAVLGEDAACVYLKRKGYRIIERNFRRGYGEIDIIALKKRTLVFIEVKTRSQNKFGTPFESVAASWKLKKLIQTALFYKQIHPTLPEDLRIDAIAVMVYGDHVEHIEHLKNITGF